MHIGFIEDTLLHGGTQIWVTEATRYFLGKGETVTILTLQGGWVAGECANVSGALPNSHLMLVGDGPGEEILTKKVKTMGLARQVSFFPFTKELVYVYEMLDILVLPSLYKEGCPMCSWKPCLWECLLLRPT